MDYKDKYLKYKKKYLYLKNDMKTGGGEFLKDLEFNTINELFHYYNNEMEKKKEYIIVYQLGRNDLEHEYGQISSIILDNNCENKATIFFNNANNLRIIDRALGPCIGVMISKFRFKLYKKNFTLF